MRFIGDTFICDECGHECSENDDSGNEDERICQICASGRYNEYLKTLCALCGKPMGDDNSDPYWNPNEEYAHGKCVEKLSDKEQMDQEWSNEWY